MSSDARFEKNNVNHWALKRTRRAWFMVVTFFFFVLIFGLWDRSVYTILRTIRCREGPFAREAENTIVGALREVA